MHFTSQEYGKSNLAEQLLVTQMNLSQLNKDMEVLKSGIDAIIEVFSPSPPVDSAHQQTLPLPPKLYETSEDVQRLRDWAVSVVKFGVKSRDGAIKVSQAMCIIHAVQEIGCYYLGTQTELLKLPR